VRLNMRASFILSTGWLAHETTVFCKRLASHLSAKWGNKYSGCDPLMFSWVFFALVSIGGAQSSISVFNSVPSPIE